MRGLAQRRRNVDLERIDQQIIPQGDRRLSPALIRCNAAWLALMEVGEFDRTVTGATGRAPLRSPDEAPSSKSSRAYRLNGASEGRIYRRIRDRECRSLGCRRQPTLEHGRETSRKRRSVWKLLAFDDACLIEEEPGEF
jgi:hypothetical protein